jgi:hypothetical protein
MVSSNPMELAFLFLIIMSLPLLSQEVLDAPGPGYRRMRGEEPRSQDPDIRPFTERFVIPVKVQAGAYPIHKSRPSSLFDSVEPNRLRLGGPSPFR